MTGDDVPRAPLARIDDEVDERRERRRPAFPRRACRAARRPCADRRTRRRTRGGHSAAAPSSPRPARPFRRRPRRRARSTPSSSWMMSYQSPPTSTPTVPGQVAGRERHAADRRQPLRQNASLHRLGDPALGLVAPGAVERLLALADERQQPLAVRIRRSTSRRAARARAPRSRAGSAIQPSSDRAGPARPRRLARGSAPRRRVGNLAVRPVEPDRRRRRRPRSATRPSSRDRGERRGRRGRRRRRRVLEAGTAHVLERDGLRERRGDGLQLAQPARRRPLPLEQLGAVERLARLAREAEDRGSGSRRTGAPRPSR